jgi:outer membrane protein assembly factor BamB/orotate phosphoribosyltransferase
MKFFRRIRAGIDVAPLLEEIHQHEDAWMINTRRQEKIQAQRDTNTIFLRSAVGRKDLHINENQESCLTDAATLFPKALDFMTEVAFELNAQLSRATIVRLKPKSQVHRHVDSGSYYFARDRYHLVLRSAAGSVLVSGDEKVTMQKGELWWFNNKQYHEAFNDSDEWRIHFIFDLLPLANLHMATNPILSFSSEAILTSEVLREAPKTLSVNKKKMLSQAIRDRAILRSENQRLISPSGKNNSWLIDLRPILMDSQLLNAVAEVFWEMCADRMPFQVGGMEVAAIPLVSAILMKSVERGTLINGFIVRKERKTYGPGNLIEGKVTDAPIIIVDDIFNSGSSLEKVRVVLEDMQRKIASVFVLINYKNTRGNNWEKNNFIPVASAFNLSDFDISLAKPDKNIPSSIFKNNWCFKAPDPNFYHRVPKSFPASDDKYIYFGSDCGIFYCLDAHDGSVAWEFKVSSSGHKNIWSAPAIYDGKVFFGSYDGNVYCLNAKTGVEIWRFGDADWVGSSPALAPDLGLLFIGLEFAVEGKRGSIAALSLRDGKKVWEHQTKRYTHASPAYWPERCLVACGSNDDEMFLFDAKTGAMRWRFETKGEGAKGSIRHAPAFDVVRGHVITGCADGYIYIIDVETGQEVWSVRTNNTIYSVPLVVGDMCYIGSTDKYLYVLDLEKRCVKRKIFAASKIYGPPRLLERYIYFGACNGVIYKIDPMTTEVIGTHQLPDAVTNALAYNAETGLFYALTYVNQLYCFSSL